MGGKKSITICFIHFFFLTDGWLKIGSQDMLAWVKKRRRTIRREDLISFLCGKAPPHRSSRANPRLAMVAPSRANSPAETGSSVEADLQPFREAIALHGEDYFEYPGSIAYFFFHLKISLLLHYLPHLISFVCVPCLSLQLFSSHNPTPLFSTHTHTHRRLPHPSSLIILPAFLKSQVLFCNQLKTHK